jgi:hypothetical protein
MHPASRFADRGPTIRAERSVSTAQLKDPEAGKRRYVARPSNEWQVRDAPELRFVDAELWSTDRRNGVQSAATAHEAGASNKARQLQLRAEIQR